jgi:hypothetical protein
MTRRRHRTGTSTSLLLLLLPLSVGGFIAGNTRRRYGRRLLSAGATDDDNDDDGGGTGSIPDEIIEAEAKSAGGRGPRLAVAGTVATATTVFGAAQAAVTQNANLAGVVPSLFDSPPATLAISFGVAGGCAALINAELETKKANQRRIWEAVKAKKKTLSAKGPSRAQRRQRGGGKVAKLEPVSAAPPSPSPSPPPAPAPAAAPAAGGGEGGGGFLEGLVAKVETAFPEANAMAANSALQLNAALEERGILEPVAQQQQQQQQQQASVEGSLADESNVTDSDAGAGDGSAKAAAAPTKTQLKKKEQARSKKKSSSKKKNLKGKK